MQGVTDAELDPYFAVGRDKHHVPEAAPGSDVPSVSADAAPAPAASSVTAEENPKTAMAKKVRTATGRALYAARKHIVEPVFGQIKRIRGFRKLLLRGAGKRLWGMVVDLPDAQPTENLETRFKRSLIFCAPRAHRGRQATSVRPSGTRKETKRKMISANSWTVS